MRPPPLAGEGDPEGVEGACRLAAVPTPQALKRGTTKFTKFTKKKRTKKTRVRLAGLEVSAALALLVNLVSLVVTIFPHPQPEDQGEAACGGDWERWATNAAPASASATSLWRSGSGDSSGQSGSMPRSRPISATNSPTGRVRTLR